MEKSRWRKTYIWTLMSGAAGALITAVCMLATGRILDTAAMGLFSLANSVSLTFQHIGTFDSRNVQCADVNDRFAFSDWFTFRVLTEGVMLVATFLFALFRQYDAYKLLLVMLFVLSRFLYGISDIFQGLLQKNGRMDIAGQSSFFHSFGQMAAFIAVLLITRSLLSGILAFSVVSLLVLLIFDIPRTRPFGKCGFRISARNLKDILIRTAPLCLILFTQMFANEMPKHAIDANLTSVDQAVYGVLLMVAAALPLFLQIMYRPLYAATAKAWADRDVKKVMKPAGICILLLFLCVIALIPFRMLFLRILGWAYGLDLSGYGRELALVIVGGGFSGLISLFYYLLIIMGKQVAMVPVFISALAASIPLAYHMVLKKGISGGVTAYVLIMIILSAALFLLILWSVIRAMQVKKKREERKNVHAGEASQSLEH